MGVGPFLGLPPAEESHVINILILAFTHIYRSKTISSILTIQNMTYSLGNLYFFGENFFQTCFFQIYIDVLDALTSYLAL